MPKSSWAWEGDEISLVTFAAAGQNLEDNPENAAALYRAQEWATDALLDAYGMSGWTTESLTAAAWAGMARLATARRDEAARALIDRGDSLRAVARVIGLTPPAVRRIIDR